MNTEQVQFTGVPTSGSMVDTNYAYHEGGSALNLVVAKLLRLLSEEKDQLLAGDLASLQSFAGQKIQLFAQLSKFNQSNQMQNNEDEAIEKIQNVKSMLLENSKLLKLRMDAIGEITDTISSAMREADSDSTYSVWPAYD